MMMMIFCLWLVFTTTWALIELETGLVVPLMIGASVLFSTIINYYSWRSGDILRLFFWQWSCRQLLLAQKSFLQVDQLTDGLARASALFRDTTVFVLLLIRIPGGPLLLLLLFLK